MKRFVWLIFLVAACHSSSEVAVISTPTEEPYYAPDFSLMGLDGETYTLSAYRGEWVLVNFWATWCEPCVAEMPFLNELAANYAVQLWGINMREAERDIRPFLRDLEISYPILINPDDATLMNYQVVGLPQSLLVNPQGELVWRQFGELQADEFRQELQGFLAAR